MHGIDLHTHSNISDGTLSPKLLIELAHTLGIKILSLTDHDSMEGLPEAAALAANYQINLISGVEISSQWSRPSSKKEHSVHVVALDMQKPEPMLELLRMQKQIRAERAMQICALLKKHLGRDLFDDILDLVDGKADRITRTHIARVMVNQQIVHRPQQAFDQYLKEGKRAYVQFKGLSLAETIQVIHQSEGHAVLAHPTRYGLSATNVRYLIELFAQLGGDAIELPPPSEALATRQMVDRMIAKLALKVSIGSDFHGENMPWIKLGQTPSPTAEQRGIWEDFAHLNFKVSHG